MAVPIIPARDTKTSAEWYRDHLGFEVVHVERHYAIVEERRARGEALGARASSPSSTVTATSSRSSSGSWRSNFRFASCKAFAVPLSL
jgi:catechol 2,3-dioxygenase-like lactoylglutathione lyase family enzyme